MIELRAGAYRLAIEPERGGSVAAFDWAGAALFRPTCGPSILDTACFPLVPFSNRIAFGRFDGALGPVRLSPNLPRSDHPHPLHGFGWLAPWTVEGAGDRSARLSHSYEPGEWPWRYRAEQVFDLSQDGLVHRLGVVNLGETPMPAGLGVHPYFPAGPGTRYHGLHAGEWQTGSDGLPITLHRADRPIDWWHGDPVASRSVDTLYTGREGPLDITWPDRALRLVIRPDALLANTVVYTPPAAAFFCVEPVSHMTDAINRAPLDGGLRWLAPGERLDTSVSYAACGML